MDEVLNAEEESQRIELIEDLRRMQGWRCKLCTAALCGHELLMNVVAGHKQTPLCLACLARLMGRQREEMRDHLYNYIMRRTCRRAAWLWVNEQEGTTALPACLWSGIGDTRDMIKPEQSMADIPEQAASNLNPDAKWDAGNMGCGELVMALRLCLQAMQPGQILKLRATDDGAPEDLPAWCRLTGHELIVANHPEYWIRRKER